MANQSTVDTLGRDHSACGVVLRVDSVPSHELVTDALEKAALVEYRSGYNHITGESDGAGVRLFGLPTAFYQRLLAEGKFCMHPVSADGRYSVGSMPVLHDGCYAIGQYFLSNDREEQERGLELVEACLRSHSLMVVGWRHLNNSDAVDVSMLTCTAKEKMPSIWQAIIVTNTANLPSALLLAAIQLSRESRARNIKLSIVSQSAESVVYKGMIRPCLLGRFYLDLLQPDFTAHAYFDHARFATNTNPQWANAQPCVFFWAHNGELNSAHANASEMREELDDAALREGFTGIYPDVRLSDSMQFDADLANQIALRKCSLLEAFTRLMPPVASPQQYNEETQAMLHCFRLQRTPYNGPTFAVAGYQDCFVAKLDAVGLRPSRWALLEDKTGHRRLCAASDDLFTAPEGGVVLRRGHLEPGGMLVVSHRPTMHLMTTKEILQSVAAVYQAEPSNDHFQRLLQTTAVNFTYGTSILHDSEITVSSFSDLKLLQNIGSLSHSALRRQLFAVGWDEEALEQVVRYMATYGSEKVGAMGDDTHPLHVSRPPPHIAHYFHQLFAQVSAPPLDSTNEPDNFCLQTSLGAVLGAVSKSTVSRSSQSTCHNLQHTSSSMSRKLILRSPVLAVQDLSRLEHQRDVKTHVLHTTYSLSEADPESDAMALSNALRRIQGEAVKLALSEDVASGGGIILLSDRTILNHSNDGDMSGHLAIPDVLVVAAVRKALEAEHLVRRVSLVTDSLQVSGPHHLATLLALGVQAVFCRGAYCAIRDLVGTAETDEENRCNEWLRLCDNYQHAAEKSLLKTMGRMGITDIDNYINGRLVAALGLDLSPTVCSSDGEEKGSSADLLLTLGDLFSGVYSPVKGCTLRDVSKNIVSRHRLACDVNVDFSIMPSSGHYMPEKGGVQHGYGPATVNAFTDWMKQEEVRAVLCRMQELLQAKNSFQKIQFVTNDTFSPSEGFLDPRHKLPSPADGAYPADYLESFRPSVAFLQMCSRLEAQRRLHPTCLRDHLILDESILLSAKQSSVMSQESIRRLLFAGSMSQGALTVSNPLESTSSSNAAKLGAHEVLTRGLNAIGCMSASGEGGEDRVALRTTSMSCRSKQVASGRFGVSAAQLVNAVEVEIKVAQGAKPGEGGQLPGSKVSVRFAAQRGGLPGSDFISPPPHHDIYSIEDLEQLIHDIKSVHPLASVAVKLVASHGIGTIAVGVVKAGADVVNVAGNSGGTGAASQSSIKHAGYPAELGLAEVHRALCQARLRDLALIRVSGGFKTAEDVLLAALLGADLFEFGTTAMLTLGCKMQRTCNLSCQPGVATDGHLFKGDQLHIERYFVNVAATIQQRLRELGVSTLRELRGRTDLLRFVNYNSNCDSRTDLLLLHQRYDLSVLFQSSESWTLVWTEKEQQLAQEYLQNRTKRYKEDNLVETIASFFSLQPDGHFRTSTAFSLDTLDRSFGARIAGKFLRHLEAHPLARITLNTTGAAGQSLGFVLPRNMTIIHTGVVQDGAGKSMTGGCLAIVTPPAVHHFAVFLAQDNTIAGNALFYGASGGKGFVNGVAGHRFAILLKGAEVSVEGAGDLAFEYMTSGTGLLLGRCGKGLGLSASGGVIFAYDPTGAVVRPMISASLRCISQNDATYYEPAIRGMLYRHFQATGSALARDIFNRFDLSHFLVLLPIALDRLHSAEKLLRVMQTYTCREAPISCGMRVWLQTRLESMLVELSESSASSAVISPTTRQTLVQMQTLLEQSPVLTNSIHLTESKENYKSYSSEIYFEDSGESRSSSLLLDESARRDLLQRLQRLLRFEKTPNVLENSSTRPKNTTVSISRVNKAMAEDFGIDLSSALLHRNNNQQSSVSTASPRSIANASSVDSLTQLHLTHDDSFSENKSLVKINHHNKNSINYKSVVRLVQPIDKRLRNVRGELDLLLLDTVQHLHAYVSETVSDAQGCSSCRAQSCSSTQDLNETRDKQTGCPSGKPIHRINAALKSLGTVPSSSFAGTGGRLTQNQWSALRQAFALQVQDSPFIAYTGAACPAPCQDACTETIPGQQEVALLSKSGYKSVGEAVHIRDVEFSLFLVGRALGWFDNNGKTFSEDEIQQLFGSVERKGAVYDSVIRRFSSPFSNLFSRLGVHVNHCNVGKRLVVVGSGPAAMQLAFEALRDDLCVEMYERSDRAGGLLADGIPHHKFDKVYIEEDFARLQRMGLVLSLRSEIVYDASRAVFIALVTDLDTNTGNVVTTERLIAKANDPDVHIALCLGAGLPVTLDEEVLRPLNKSQRERIVQAVDLLKAANDVASLLQQNTTTTEERVVVNTLGRWDPRGKRVVVVGGGDTAQDCVRWIARYFSLQAEHCGDLQVLVRGLPPSQRAIWDGYPSLSRAPTKENVLKQAEIEFVKGDVLHSVYPKLITGHRSSNNIDGYQRQEEGDNMSGTCCVETNNTVRSAEEDASEQLENTRLTVHLQKVCYAHQNTIESDAELKRLDALVPREMKPRDRPISCEPIREVDLVVCALGFQGRRSLHLARAVEDAGLTNVSFAGDSAETQAKIIVGAQASAKDTYRNRIRPLLRIVAKKSTDESEQR